MARDSVIKAYIAIVIVLCFTQLVLGCDWLLLITFASISCAALIPLTAESLWASDIFFLVIVAYTSLAALILKSLLGQALQTNLWSPVESSLYLLCGFCSAMAGYVLARLNRRQTRLSKDIIKIFQDIGKLQWAAMSCFLVGVATNVLHIILRPQYIIGTTEMTEGIGFFGSFYYIMIIGVACQAKYIYGKENISQKGGVLLLGMIFSSFVLAIGSNTKFAFLAILFCAVLSAVFNNSRRSKIKDFVAAGVILIFGALFISPVIHLMRADVSYLTLGERFEKAVSILVQAGFDPFLLDQELNEAAVIAGNDPRLNYLFPYTTNLDRFCMIQPVDQIVDMLPSRGVPGLEVFSSLLSTLLPSFLIDKHSETSVDIIAWYYGIRSRISIARPVIGLTAGSIAVGELFTLIVFPLLGTFLVCFLIDSFSGPLANNPVAHFVTSMSICAAEYDFPTIISFLMREFFLMVGFLVFLKILLDQGDDRRAVQR